MKSNLSAICFYVREKIMVESLTKKNYVSTENLLPNKGGLIEANSLPTAMLTQSYKAGDILISNIRPYFKKIYFAQENGGCSNDVLVIRAKEHTNPKFLYYVLSDNAFFNYSMATSKGTKMPRGDKIAIMQYQVPILSLNTQIKISSVLSDLDEKIALNNKINNNLLDQALTLFKEHFVSTNATSEMLSLYEFAEYINGAAFKPKELSDMGLPVIKIAELKSGITDSTRYFSGNKDEKYIVSDKDILFSWSGNPETSIDIFIWTFGKGILNQHTFNVKSKFNCHWFTYLLLKYHKPTFIHIASNKQTTGLGHVTATDLKRLKFPFNLSKIQNFETLVSPIMELYFNNLIENRNLANTRNTLLPQLVSGQLDVSAIEL